MLKWGETFYYVLFNIIMLVLFFFFSIQNFFLFFLFFEASLLPIILVIGLWGSQPQRIIANYYFFMYTLIRAFPLLVCVLYSLNRYINSFGLIMFGGELVEIGGILMARLFLRFLCKLPLYRLHL